MLSNLEKYKKDLEQLIEDGNILRYSIQNECFPEQFEEELKDVGVNYKKVIQSLPRFSEEYQS